MKLFNRIVCLFKGHVKHTDGPAAIALSWTTPSRLDVNLDFCTRCNTLFAWEYQRVDTVAKQPELFFNPAVPKLSDLLQSDLLKQSHKPNDFNMDFEIDGSKKKLLVRYGVGEELGEYDLLIKSANGKISKWSVDKTNMSSKDVYDDICHSLASVTDPIEVIAVGHIFTHLDYYRPPAGIGINGIIGYGSFTNAMKSFTWVDSNGNNITTTNNANPNTSGTVPEQEEPS